MFQNHCKNYQRKTNNFTGQHDRNNLSIKSRSYSQVLKWWHTLTPANRVDHRIITGLSAILMHKTPDSDDKWVVAYASRTLTAVKRQYSQTEKQALAIVWAIEKLHIYLYWSQFKMITNRKPVQLIFSNPKSKPPAWIQCWNLRLTKLILWSHSHWRTSQLIWLSVLSLDLQRGETMLSNWGYMYISFNKCSPKSYDFGRNSVGNKTRQNSTMRVLADKKSRLEQTWYTSNWVSRGRSSRTALVQ